MDFMTAVLASLLAAAIAAAVGFVFRDKIPWFSSKKSKDSAGERAVAPGGDVEGATVTGDKSSAAASHGGVVVSGEAGDVTVTIHGEDPRAHARIDDLEKQFIEFAKNSPRAQRSVTVTFALETEEAPLPGRDVDGPTVTGDKSAGASRGGIAIGGDATGATFQVNTQDSDARERIALVEKRLEEFEKNQPQSPEGAVSIGTDELARAAGPDTARLMDEALQLQAEHRESEAVDALYAAFQKDLEPNAKAELHVLLGNSFIRLSAYREAEGHYRQALDASRQAGHREVEAASLGNLGVVYHTQGDFARAEDHHQQSLQIKREIGNKLGEANSLGNLGLVYTNHDDLDRAVAHHQRALEIHREIGDRLGEANDLGNLGIAYKNQGDLSRAEEHLQGALTIQREISDRLGEANQLGNLGNVYGRQGDLDRAKEHYQRSLDINREIGNRLGVAQSLGNLGNIYKLRGDLKRAEEHYKQALEIHRGIGDKLNEANQLGNLGLLAAKRNRSEEACRLLKEALAIFEEIGAGGPNLDIVRAKLEELGCE